MLFLASSAARRTKPRFAALTGTNCCRQGLLASCRMLQHFELGIGICDLQCCLSVLCIPLPQYHARLIQTKVETRRLPASLFNSCRTEECTFGISFQVDLHSVIRFPSNVFSVALRRCSGKSTWLETCFCQKLLARSLPQATKIACKKSARCASPVRLFQAFCHLFCDSRQMVGGQSPSPSWFSQLNQDRLYSSTPRPIGRRKPVLLRC